MASHLAQPAECQRGFRTGTPMLHNCAGLIVEIDILADADRLRGLDLPVLDN